MISLLPILAAVVWFAMSVSLRNASSFVTTRRLTTLVLAGTTAVCGVAWLVVADSHAAAVHTIWGRTIVWSTTGFVGLSPAVISLIGVVALALSDSISHSIATLRRILVLLSIAMAFVATREPAVMALLWMLSPVIAWAELKSLPSGKALARVFAIYHVPSIILFAAFVVLQQAGFALASAIAVVTAIGIREAVIPGHSWFPRFVEDAPMGLVVAFVAPQLGVYAHVQLLSQNLPHNIDHTVVILGAVTALLAAALGLAQTSTRRALAYFMMSQTGLVAFGLRGDSDVAAAGSLLAWQVLAIATSGFAMTISALEARRGPLSLSRYSGCFARTPRMAAGFMVMGLASVGFPLTLGFVAEDLLVQGSVADFPLLAFVLIGATALNGMNVMRAFFRLFSGVRVHDGERDLTPREAWALSTILIVLLLGGLAPGPIISREFDAGADHQTHLDAVSVDSPAQRIPIGLEP